MQVYTRIQVPSVGAATFCLDQAGACWPWPVLASAAPRHASSLGPGLGVGKAHIRGHCAHRGPAASTGVAQSRAFLVLQGTCHGARGPWFISTEADMHWPWNFLAPLSARPAKPRAPSCPALLLSNIPARPWGMPLRAASHMPGEALPSWAPAQQAQVLQSCTSKPKALASQCGQRGPIGSARIPTVT